MSTITDSGKQTGKPTVPPNAAVANIARPETFRLPKSGGDPYFGIGRSFYYRGEQLGYWKLIRIRERNKQRGLTLVPYDEVAAFVRTQMQGGAH